MARKKNFTKHYLSLKKPFLGIPNSTLISTELNKLPVHARWLYLILLTRFNRENSRVRDKIVFTYKDLSDITGFDDRQIATCIKELEEAEFIEVVHGWKHTPSKYQPDLKWLS